jgi:hypothetical protein
MLIMAIPTDAEQARISTFKHSPSRSSAVANKGNNLPNVVEFCDVNAKSPTTVDINIRQNTYVLTKEPNASNVPNPNIGDIARVFFVDDARAVNPYDYAEYHYKPLGTNPPAWRRVRYLGE